MFGACTIIASNYVAYARVLASSFQRFHPGHPFWVLVVDDPEGQFVSDNETFTVLHLSDVAIGDSEAHQFAAIYDVLEMSTAVKPWLLQHLVADAGHPVLYLDPDIEIFGDLTNLAELAGEHGLAVTPHLLRPLPLDNLLPDDAHILAAGIYNLGFLGVGPAALASGFIEYWQSRLWRNAVVDLERQLFTDQRWVDLVCCFDHTVIRDVGCNVAYWNVWARPIRQSEGQWFAGDQPLRFFHFSGFDPALPWILSKHQGDRPRVLLSEQPDLALLCRHYAWALLEAGHEAARERTYGWSKAGELTLTPAFRRAYRTELKSAEQKGELLPPNPFDDPDKFMTWLATPAFSTYPIPRFVMAEYERRPDLQAAFPDPRNTSSEAFLNWAQVDDAFRLSTGDALVNRLGDAQATTSSPLPGINVFGYLSAELGVGAIGRLVIQSARAAGIPFAARDNVNTISRKEHPSAQNGERDWRYDINIVCANADATRDAVRDLGAAGLEARKTVGVWHWEAERLPDHLLSAWDHVDEVWTTSRFQLDSFSRDATKPVRLFPLPVPVSNRMTSLTRQDVGLPDGFVILFCFDWLSVVERKNPFGLIEAYERAFRPGEGAHLVIKSINGTASRAQFERLALSIDRPDIHLIDGYVNWLESEALMDLCDCYASLHRSEGFGLTMAEAMAHAKPVVATGWSGNLDFMDESVSRLVPVELIPIAHDVPTYGGIGSWADPDLDAASNALRWVFDNQHEAEQLGRQAQEHLRRTRSPIAAGLFLEEQTARLRSELGRSFVRSSL